MPHDNGDSGRPARPVSRRRVLGVVGSGLGALTVGTGGVAATPPERHIVGTASKRATRAAKREADSVHRVLRFGALGEAVAGVYPEDALDGLRRRPDVRYIEPDGVMHAVGIDSDESEVPWGVDRVDAEKAHSDGETGAGAHIAVIDTGIDSDHPDLEPNLGAGRAFVNARGPYAEQWDDDNGHGTHCAGIADAVNDGSGVVGTSTEATLHAVKVLDNSGSGSWSDVAAGIEYTADQGWDVGSMSLGGGTSQTVRDACQYAFDNGVLLVAAAGNDGGDVADSAPAAYSTVMAVSATDRNDALASFSNTGGEIELAAPGVDIYSTYAGGGYDTLSGTSMACPHVSGAGGQVMANGYSSTDARSQLRDTAEDIGLPSSEQGAGLLDVEAAVSDSSTDSAPAVDSLSLSEVEASDSDAEFDASWSVSDADGDLASVDLVLTEDSDGTQEDTATVSDVGGDTASGTTRLVADSDDGSGNSYTVELTVTDTAGNTDSATASATETESTNSAPTVESYTVTEAESPNPHAEITADWSVADTDGDLATVVIKVIDTDGSEVDSTTHDVSGPSASGSDQFTVKHADGETFDVTLTVTDAAGNDASDTGTVTE